MQDHLDRAASAGESDSVEPTLVHLGSRGRDTQLAAAGLAAARSVAPLVFNPNNPVTGVVERIDLVDGSSVVRKVICRDRPMVVPHWPPGSNSQHWNYWRREVHAYDEGLVNCFEAAGLRAPELVARDSPSDGVEVLFIEFVDGPSGVDLSLGDLRRVAKALGRVPQTQAVVDSAPLPSWGSQDWMWHYALSRPPGPDGYQDASAWEHPVVVEGFGSARHDLRVRFGSLLADGPRWQRLMLTLPRTVAHMDCWANNLIVPRGADPVLLDWSFCGIGVVGEDAGNLVADGFLDHYFDPSEYVTVDSEVSAAFAAGLEESGWPHRQEVARLGMCAAVLKFVWLPGLMVRNAGFSGPTAYGGQPGHELVQVFRRRREVFYAMLDRVDEARKLIAQLGLAF